MNAKAQVVEDTAAAYNNVRTARYARCINASKRVRWDIDADVIRGREFDLSQTYLPKGLSKIDELPFLTSTEARLLSQVQGRTYANLFGLIERYVSAKVLELSRNYWFTDQTALHALVRFSEEELKHQELFRRIEEMISRVMPAGYRVAADPNAVAQFILGKSTWSVLALTCFVELVTQQHYTASIQPETDVSPLWKDVFMFHWKEECQHAMIDELEWEREHAKVAPAQRDAAVTDLIDLVAGVDGLVQAQAALDAEYFMAIAGREFGAKERDAVQAGVLKAYRWQYIGSGVQHPHFMRLLTNMTTPEQMARIGQGLAPIVS